MTITKDQVETLGQLYKEREDIQKVRELANRFFWLDVAKDMFAGTGTRSSVVSKLGGSSEFASLMERACAVRFEAMQQDIDAAIIENGGTP